MRHQDMPLHVSVFKCAHCGLRLYRDINARINILSAGTSQLRACGEMRIGCLNEKGICGIESCGDSIAGEEETLHNRNKLRIQILLS